MQSGAAVSLPAALPPLDRRREARQPELNPSSSLPNGAERMTPPPPCLAVLPTLPTVSWPVLERGGWSEGWRWWGEGGRGRMVEVVVALVVLEVLGLTRVSQ